MKIVIADNVNAEKHIKQNVVNMSEGDTIIVPARLKELTKRIILTYRGKEFFYFIETN